MKAATTVSDHANQCYREIKHTADVKEHVFLSTKTKFTIF